MYGLFKAYWKPIQFIYGLLKGRIVYFIDYKQDLQIAQSTIQKVAQRASQEEFPMYFLICFTVLLRQLRKLYISGPIFQVPLVYNYSTCRTNRVLTRSVRRVHVYAFGALTTHLRVWCTYKALTNQGGGALVYRLRSLLYTIDSYHRLNKHTILYVFRAPRHDSLILLNQYQH